jgi:GFO/IDH/MocA oxidoreductase family protein
MRAASWLGTAKPKSHSEMIAWDFPARGGLPPLRVHWYDGGMRPHRPIELDARTPMPPSGMLIVGDKGKMLTAYSGGKERLLPESRFKDFERPAKTLPRTSGHYREWMEACKTGKPTSCNFEFGSKMVKIALLGTMAARAARLLEWDAENERVTNDAEANSWVNPPYRTGWSS